MQPLRQGSSAARLCSTKEGNKENVTRMRKLKKDAPERSQADSGYLEAENGGSDDFEEQQQTPKQESAGRGGVPPKASAALQPAASNAEPSVQGRAAPELKAFTLAIVPVDLPPGKPSPGPDVTAAAGTASRAAARKKSRRAELACGEQAQPVAGDRSCSSVARATRSTPSQTAATADEAAVVADEPETTGGCETVVVKQTYSRENKRLRFSLPDDRARVSSGGTAAGDASTPAHHGVKWPVSAVLDTSNGDVLSPIAFSSSAGGSSSSAPCQTAAADSGYASFDGDGSTAEHASLLLPQGKVDLEYEPAPAAIKEPSKRRAKQTLRERLREWEDRRCAELEQIEQLELVIE